MRRSPLAVGLAALALLPLVASCTAGNSSVPGGTCATTADCAPNNVCLTPTGQCVPVPNDEFIGTFRCYVVNLDQDIPPGDLGSSQVEGSYQGTDLDILAGTRCALDTAGSSKALLVEIDPVPGQTGDVTGLLFVLSWPTSAPVNLFLGAAAGMTNSGVLLASADGGPSSVLATATNVGFVRLEQAPVVGQWVSGYVDAPVH